jgi:uncharacterized membrane protein
MRSIKRFYLLNGLSFFTLLFFAIFSAHAQLTLLGSGRTATDCSADGSVVVGYDASQHFMWTETTGVMLIGGSAPGAGVGGQTAISADGSLIAGTRINPSNNLAELSSYDVGTGQWTSHGSLGSSSGNSASSAWGISSDGETIVGLGWVNAGSAHGIRYTSAEGVVDLGSTVAGSSSRANTANDDGSIIGGWQDSSTGFRQGAIWTNGVQALITHPNGDPATEVGTLSDDGVWAGGGSGFANNFQAWIWSQNTGIIDIGPAPTAGWRGAISGLNANGSVAVGFYRPFPAPATFGRGIYYTQAQGLLDLTDYAVSLGIDVQGAILALPLGLSDDGSTVVGITDSGQGFVLKLPTVPLNDSCADAISLSCNDIAVGSTTNATDTGGNPAPDVFYTFTNTDGFNSLILSTCSGTNFDTVIRVYSDCSLTNEIASNDDSCGQQSELSFEPEADETYYIMVEGAGTESGDFQLEILCGFIGTEDFTFSDLTLYPNPVEDQLNIQNGFEIEQVEIYSVTGQLVRQLSGSGRLVKVNTANLTSGMYFATVYSNGEVSTVKFIK